MKKYLNKKYVKNYIIDILLLASIISLILIHNINFLPTKYYVLIVLLFIIINIINIIFSKLKKKIFKYIFIIFSIIILLFNNIITIGIINANKFINNSFSGSILENTTYYIVANKNSNYTKNNIKGSITYNKNLYNKNKVFKLLKNNYKVSFKEYENINIMLEDLYNNNTKLMVIDKISYNITTSFNNEYKNNLKIIKKFNIKSLKKAKSKNKSIFNLYIVGNDFAGLNDFNMIVTINMKTRKILLTSIPRDYHIPVYGYDNISDNLSYLSACGIDTSIKSIENYFNIKIDYYLKINTSSLVNLVDQIDGIEFCSDQEFITTHALVVDTYDDKEKEKFHVKKGCQHLNGIQTLTVSRERLHVNGADVTRQKNCRKIIIAIMNKIKTFDSVINYNNLLDSLSDLYETTLSKEIISSLIKDNINNKSKWEILEQEVYGTGEKGYVHLNSVKDFIMIPDSNSVINASEKIKSIERE